MAPNENIENKELISGLMMFNSSNLSNSDEVVTFDDYIKNMKSDQEQIYFCVADTHEAAINSPHIEKLKSNGIYPVSYKVDERVELLSEPKWLQDWDPIYPELNLKKN